ncbi:MAG: LamG domain-containing protein, partial [Phycisphaerales bacterium]
FDRDGGTRAVDISGMDFHGELHGCEYTKEGCVGGAMRFDGDDDHISISGVKLHAFTFSAWVKTNTESMNNRRLFLLDDGEQYYALQGTTRGDVELSGGDFRDDDPEPVPEPQLLVNEWTYVTATFDGDAFKVYKNSVLTRSGRSTHGALTGTAYLGGIEKHRGRFWSGLMDEVVIFNRALSAGEVRQLYSVTGGLDEASDALVLGTPALRGSGSVLYYSFDDSQGLLVTDKSGQGHHGNVHGASYESNGRIGGAMSFDGDDDYISTSDISLREFTFSAWVKTHTRGLNNRRIFLLSDGEHCYALQGNIRGSVGIYVADDLEINEYHWSFELGRWTHIAVTHDGNTFKIYKDGRLTEIGPIRTSGVAGTLYIGGTDRHRGDFWHGMIDELLIFNRALSDSQIERLYGLATGTSYGSVPARTERRADITGEHTPASRFEGVWSGMAVDKPGEGSSTDSLRLELNVDESGGLAGTASGEFVREDRCELKNLRISGSRISFEVAHRIANLRMGVTLDLEDGILRGEGLPIDFEENSCDIVLRRESAL